MSPTRSDHVQRDGLRDERPQPLKPTVDLPARFVGIHDDRLADGSADGHICFFGTMGRPQNNLGRPASADTHAEEVFENTKDVPVTEAVLVLEQRNGGLGVGSQLRACRSYGIRALTGVSTVNPLTAPHTPTRVDVKASIDGAPGNLHLILMRQRVLRIFLYLTTAMLALPGQGARR